MTMLSIVIPAYNEESGIAEIANRVLDTKDALSDVGVDELELLVVDDGSSDNTVPIMRQIMDQFTNVRLICHPQNRGYGESSQSPTGKADRVIGIAAKTQAAKAMATILLFPIVSLPDELRLFQRESIDVSTKVEVVASVGAKKPALA